MANSENRASNGSSNGTTNGSANGTTNGSASGTANGSGHGAANGDIVESSLGATRTTGSAPIAHWNAYLARLSAPKRIEAALKHLPANHALTSSFGAQAAVSLHLLTSQRPDIPIILLDTGYLFPETYRFIEDLTARLDLNVRIYRSERNPAWQEAVHGQRWLQGVDGINAYNEENKVEPLRRALAELRVGTWFTGLRRDQASTRAGTPFVQMNGDRFKVNPIADWNDRDIYDYLKANDLPYHPLWEQGYVSIGDTHTTRPLHEVENAEDTRFFGLKRECGIHELGDD